MAEHMLSTVDNPYNPFHQFDEWNAWDMMMGYHSLAFLARVVVTSDDLSPADESVALENAIDEIVSENIYGVHVKVTADSVVPRTSLVHSDSDDTSTITVPTR